MAQSAFTAWSPARETESYRTHLDRLRDTRTRESTLIPAPPQTVFPPSATRTTVGRSQVLFCGSEQPFIAESFHPPRLASHLLTPFLPGEPAAGQRPQMLRRSSGCGAQVHIRASAEFGLWTGLAHRQAYTVIPLDAQYVSNEAVALLARPGRQGCGCANEFVGCAVCGNHLGARLTPCTAHVLSLGPGTYTFLPSSVSPPHPNPDNTILPPAGALRPFDLMSYANQDHLVAEVAPPPGPVPPGFRYSMYSDSDDETEIPRAPPPLPSLSLDPPSAARAL
ncbi:hypothetical protein DFH08DRAFT_936817, partial [Mycena albidolilacea]